MGQFSKVLLAIEKAHTVPERAQDCGPCLGGLNQVMCPTIPLILWQVYQHLCQMYKYESA